MKIRFLIVAVISVFFFGCDDQLDRFPIDELVEETAFQTVGDLQFGVNAVIGNYSPTLLVAHNSIFTDNIKLGTNNGGQELNALAQILNPDQGDRNIWENRYGVINDANRVLAAAGGITPDGPEQEQYDNILAQCYAFRAMAHWDLLLYYGLDVTDPSAPGVPYIDFVSADAQPARNSTSEVVAAIEADLSEAFALLGGVTPDINFANRDMITFLRARIALETGDYQGAITASDNIIANYPLANQQQYFDMFREDADVTEVVWKYDNVQGFNYNMAGIWYFTASGFLVGSAFMEMSNGLLNSFDPADIRRVVNWDDDPDAEEGEILIAKYPPNADTQFINDYKAMRSSEAYLIKAEAHARLTQLGPAADAVFAVRNARFGGLAAPISYASQVEAMQDILDERRLELCFEGHRYNDIKRMRDVLNQGIERDPLDCGGSGAPCSLPANDARWIFPAPTVEINANPNILPQAPGY
jgi:hypothetical protein